MHPTASLARTSAFCQPRLRTALWATLACIVAGCATRPPPPAPVAVVKPPAPVVVAPVVPPAAPPKPEAPVAVEVVRVPSVVSQAATARDYRRDAAAHLYKKLSTRIFNGKMPPLLQAVGVLQVDIDQHGDVIAVRWMRAPSHVPAVMAEIERSVRAAAPYPAPVKLGQVTYTDTWLWHKSGRFQLDTLTEGQI